MDQVAGQERSGEEGRKGLSHIPFVACDLRNFRELFSWDVLYCGEIFRNWGGWYDEKDAEKPEKEEDEIYVDCEWDTYNTGQETGDHFAGYPCKVYIRWGGFEIRNGEEVRYHKNVLTIQNPQTMQDIVDAWPDELPPLTWVGN